MYRSILIPLDGSEFSEYALPIARTIAQHTPAEMPVTLHLVRVHEPIVPSHSNGVPIVDVELDTQMREHEYADLDSIHTRLLSDPNVCVTFALIEGPITAALTEYIAAHRIDLVVMTTHGRGGLQRFWLGSIADELVRHGPAPVLLIRPPTAVTTKEYACRRILIPLDGSEIAEEILAHAMTLGETSGAEYHLLRIVEPLLLTGYSPVAYAADLPDRITQQQVAEAQEYLAEVAQRLQPLMTRVVPHVVIAPQPAAAILKIARDYTIDLIALATHGRGGLSRLLIGSTADKVMRGATVPVLIHRPDAQPVAQNQAEHAIAIER